MLAILKDTSLLCIRNQIEIVLYWNINSSKNLTHKNVISKTNFILQVHIKVKVLGSPAPANLMVIVRPDKQSRLRMKFYTLSVYELLAGTEE